MTEAPTTTTASATEKTWPPRLLVDQSLVPCELQSLVRLGEFCVELSESFDDACELLEESLELLDESFEPFEESESDDLLEPDELLEPELEFLLSDARARGEAADSRALDSKIAVEERRG